MNVNTGERLAATGLALSISLAAMAGAAPEAEALTKASAADIKELQLDLNADLSVIGMPKLVVDGVLGAQSRRALCAERLLTGRVASKADPSKEEIQQLKLQDKLSYKTAGLIVSRRCQFLAISTPAKTISNVFPVSTGNPATGSTTPSLSTRISFARTGWHNSTLYPTETGNGNMYKPLYFASGGGLAIHGSRAMNPGVTTPESHGCVRTTPANQDIIWKAVNGPTTTVQDKVVSVTSMPIHILV